MYLVWTEYLTINSDLNLPRASFADCVQQIYSDLEKAEELLPWEYNDVNEVPADFQSITQDKGKYNTVMGEKSRQLFNGLIARAYRVRTALLAASPAFQDASNPASWADAAMRLPLYSTTMEDWADWMIKEWNIIQKR